MEEKKKKMMEEELPKEHQAKCENIVANITIKSMIIMNVNAKKKPKIKLRNSMKKS